MNSSGSFIHSNYGFISERLDAEAAELEAMSQALSYATTKCSCNILFISDCSNVVNFPKGHTENNLCPTSLKPLVGEPRQRRVLLCPSKMEHMGACLGRRVAKKALLN